MNGMLCVKQGRSPALRFYGDLIRLMAETCRGIIPTCQCQEALNVSFGNRPEMGKACGPNSPFLVKLPSLFDHFLTSWELELLTYLSDHRLSRDLWSMLLLCTVCYLGPKLGLVVRKHLASLGVESSEARGSSSSKSIRLKVTQIGSAMSFFLS